MLERFIREGDKVELRRATAVGNDNSGKYYVSNVIEILDDNRVGISMPVERGQLISLDIGERYKICFYTDKGLYQCKAEVKERFKKSGFYIAVFKFISDFEKIQRRQFFRINCLLEIRYRKIDDDSPPDGEPKNPGPWQTATAIDISGGGIRFNCSEYKEDDSKYEIEFDIPLNNSFTHVKVVSKIVYISDLANRSGMYEYRLEFVQLPPKAREAIVRFVFDEERRRRQKDIK